MRQFHMFLMLIIVSPLFATESSQFHYQLVKLIKIENNNFKSTSSDGEVYTEINYPNCQLNGEPAIDIGDYYLGPDCFYGNIQYVKVIDKKDAWRIQIPICYSSRTYNFVRTIKVFCKYPQELTKDTTYQPS